MCVHVFGAPCAFSPMDGYYVGVQHPMVLVIRKSDMKLVSVSKKKIVVYESMYIAPLSLSSEKLNEVIVERETRTTGKVDENKPTHVQSIKSVSAHQIPVPNTTAHLLMPKPTQLTRCERRYPVPKSGGGGSKIYLSI
jgi:hypothetical protein